MISLMRSLWTPILRVFGRLAGVATIAESTASATAVVSDSTGRPPVRTTHDEVPDPGALRTAASSPDSAADFAAHLEFLGYAVEAESDGWHHAHHPSRYNFALRWSEVGLRMHSDIIIGASLPGGRRAWLEWVNMANERALVGRFSLVEDDAGVHRLRMRSLFSGAYDRRSFGARIDMWHEDLGLLRYAPAADQQERKGSR